MRQRSSPLSVRLSGEVMYRILRFFVKRLDLLLFVAGHAWCHILRERKLYYFPFFVVATRKWQQTDERIALYIMHGCTIILKTYLMMRSDRELISRLYGGINKPLIDDASRLLPLSGSTVLTRNLPSTAERVVPRVGCSLSNIVGLIPFTVINVAAVHAATGWLSKV